MLGFVANSLVMPVVARRLSRVIPNPFVRAIAVAAVGYGVNRLVTTRQNRQVGAAPRPNYLPNPA